MAGLPSKSHREGRRTPSIIQGKWPVCLPAKASDVLGFSDSYRGTPRRLEVDDGVERHGSASTAQRCYIDVVPFRWRCGFGRRGDKSAIRKPGSLKTGRLTRSKVFCTFYVFGPSRPRHITMSTRFQACKRALVRVWPALAVGVLFINCDFAPSIPSVTLIALPRLGLDSCSCFPCDGHRAIHIPTRIRTRIGGNLRFSRQRPASAPNLTT